MNINNPFLGGDSWIPTRPDPVVIESVRCCVFSRDSGNRPFRHRGGGGGEGACNWLCQQWLLLGRDSSDAVSLQMLIWLIIRKGFVLRRSHAALHPTPVHASLQVHVHSRFAPLGSCSIGWCCRSSGLFRSVVGLAYMASKYITDDF